MFTLLRDLGRHVKEAQGQSDLDQLAGSLGEEYVYGLAICFGEGGSFQGVTLTEGQDDIVYKFGNPRGNDYTLVSKTAATTENVVPRLRRNAEKIVDWGDAEDPVIDALERCLSTAEDEEDRIVEEVLDRYPEDASTSKRVFAYWARQVDGAIEPFCATETVKEFLADAVLKSYAERSAAPVPMIDESGTCAICGEDDVRVYGNFSDIACYNIDKQGFITGGFSYEQTTNNFPVCRSCILAVRGAREFTEDHLDSYMAGLDYWLLPEARDDDVYRVLLEKIRDRDRQTLGSEAESITADEEEILGYMADALGEEEGQAPATLNFFFYESSQGAWRIVGEMRRILPSRIHQLYEAKARLETGHPELILSSSEADDGYHFNLPRLQPFCGSFETQNNRKLIRYLEAIFQEQPLRERTVVTDLVDGILSAHKNALDRGRDGHARFTVRDAWATYLFLDDIEAIERQQGDGTLGINYDKDNEYTRYIRENPDYFQDPERTAAFLTGCYVGQVMYAQYQENPSRDTQPFAKKFLGRKLNRNRLEKLVNEGKEKLTQYERSYLVQDLDPVLAETWVQVGDGWDLDKEQTTFAFNLGWTLSRQLATPDEDEGTAMEVEA